MWEASSLITADKKSEIKKQNCLWRQNGEGLGKAADLGGWLSWEGRGESPFQLHDPGKSLFSWVFGFYLWGGGGRGMQVGMRQGRQISQSSGTFSAATFSESIHGKCHQSGISVFKCAAAVDSRDYHGDQQPHRFTTAFFKMRWFQVAKGHRPARPRGAESLWSLPSPWAELSVWHTSS